MLYKLSRRRVLYGVLVGAIIGVLFGSIHLFTAVSGAASVGSAPTAATAEQSPLLPVEDLGPQTQSITDAVLIEASFAPTLRDFATRERVGTAQLLSEFPPELQALTQVRSRVYLTGVGNGKTLQADPPVPTPRPRPEGPAADLTVTTVVSPSIRVARGGQMVVEFQLFNDGRGDAAQTQVTMRFNPRQMVPINSRLDRRAGDWVSEVKRDELTVTFGRLDDRKRRFGQVIFQVNGNLATDTLIDIRPTFSVRDARGTRTNTSNWAPVLVGGGNDTARYIWMAVDPVNGTRDDRRTFLSNRFSPGETVSAWLNVPGGRVQALNLTGTVGIDGGIRLSYRPRDLAPGTYQAVLYGQKSRLTGVASFVVR